jgi:peroxiredoxin
MLELPEFKHVYDDDEYSDRGFRILAINPYDPLATVVQTGEDLSLPFQLLMDSNHITEGIYGVSIYPSNFIIDGSGKIRYRFGYTTEEAIRADLDDIYSGP